MANPATTATLDELFEVLTWRQLGLHSKPVLLLNTRGYWTPLVDLIHHIVAQGFAEPSFLDFLTVHDDVPALMDALLQRL